MRYLHTMIRVTDLEASLDYFVRKLGMVEVRRSTSEQGRFTLVFLAANEGSPPKTGARFAPDSRLGEHLGVFVPEYLCFRFYHCHDVVSCPTGTMA